ncbi:MAG: hypothetical protein WCI91_01200, partial [Candidatus Nomurabacteria bacterium]
MKIKFIKINRKTKEMANILASSFIFLSLILAPFSPLVGKAEALFNKQINYQGKLTTSAGVAVANGTYNMEFKLYDAPTAGTTLWTETRTTTNKVQVTNGLFSAMLGEINALTGVDFNQTLYLGVNIGGTGTPGWDGEMTPRKKLGTVPAAVISETAQTSITSNITNDAATATSVYPTWVTTNSGGMAIKTSSAQLSFIPSTGALTISGYVYTPNVDAPSAVALNIGAVNQNALTLGRVGANTTINGAVVNINSNAASALNITTGTTGALTLDSGTTGIINIGTGTGGKTINIGTNNTTADTILIGSALDTIKLSKFTTNGFLKTNSADGTLSVDTTTYQTALTNPVTGTGTQNKIAKFTSTGSAIGDSQIFDNGTNVGIGTTVPGYSLQVDGTMLSNKSVYSDPTGENGFRLKIQDYGGTNNDAGLGIDSSNGPMWLNNVSGGGFYFNNGTSGRVLTINGSGAVGIGTSSPTQALSFDGTTAHTIWMERNTTAATAGQGLTLSSGGSIAGTADLAGGDLNFKSGISTGTGTSAMHFFTSTAGVTGVADNTPTEKMTILGNGNVGINATSPGSRLTISGNGGTGSGGPAVLDVTATDDGTYVWGSFVKAPNLTTGHLLISPFLGVGTGTNQSGYMGFKYASSGSTSNALTWGFYSNDQLMTLQATGNLGIGITNPGTKLDVAGTVRLGGSENDSVGDLTSSASVATHYLLTGSNNYWGLRQATSHSINFDMYNAGAYPTAMTILQNGNVGIGTTIPNAKLQIGSVGSSGYTASAGLTMGNGTQAGALNVESSGLNMYSTTGLIFSPNTSEAMRILPNGNVGIGMTAPVYKLDVSGDINTSGYIRTQGTRIGSIRSEKVLFVDFPNGVAQQAVDIILPAGTYFWGSIQFNITGTYNYINGTGLYSPRWSGGMNPAGALYDSQWEVQADQGYTADRVQMTGPFWDSTNSRWYFTLKHRVSQGNQYYLQAIGISAGAAALPGFEAMTVSSVYVYGGGVPARDNWNLNNGSIIYNKPSNFFTTTGSVGIGTTSPGYKLDVNGTANIGSTLTLTTAPTTSAGGYDIVTRNTGTGVIEKVSSSSFASALSGTNGYNTYWNSATTLGSEQYTAVSRGGTGVGTFTTNGVLYGNSTTSILATAAGTTGQLLVANGSGVPTFVSMTGDAGIVASGALTLATVNSNVGTFNNVTVNGKGLVTAASNVSYMATPSGTLNKVAKFTGSGTTVGDSQIFDNGTSVGINTTASDLNSITQKLTLAVSGTSGSGIGIYSAQNVPGSYVPIGVQYASGNTNNGSQVRFGIDSADTYSYLGFATAHGSTPVERMRIDTNGNLGVGTTTPGYPLQVNSSAIGITPIVANGFTGQTADLQQWQVNGSAKAFINSSGNLGNSGGDIMLYQSTNRVFRGVRSTTAWSDAQDTQWFQVGNTTTDNVAFSATAGGAANRMAFITSSLHITNAAATAAPVGIFDVSNGSTKLFNVLVGGNVGIGTTTPAVKLDVLDTSGLVAAFRGSTTQGLFIKNAFNLAGASEPTLSSLTSSGNSAGPLAFGTGNNEAMRILPNGNVGIGTTNPGASLELSTASSNGDNGILKVTGTGATTSSNIGFQTIGGTGLFQLDYAGNMVFRTPQSGMYFDAQGTAIIHFRTTSSNTERLTILNNGNIGIGTTGPGSKLEIYNSNTYNPSLVTGAASGLLINNAGQEISMGGSGVSPYPNYIQSRTSGIGWNLAINPLGGNVAIGYADPGTAKLAINGNVGIGTTNPGAKLEVTGDINDKLAYFYNANSGTGSSGIDVKTNSGVGTGYVSRFYPNDGTFAGDVIQGFTYGPSVTGNLLALYRGNSAAYDKTNPVLIVKSSGNVGIGDASPGTKLSVVGNASVGYASGQTAPANGLIINGNVGIGTTGPGSQLTLSANATQANSSVSGLSITNTNAGGYANAIWNNDTGDLGQFLMTGSTGAISGTDILARQAVFTSVGGTGGLNFYTSAGPIYFTPGGGTTAKMVQLTNGNVGIGTTGPTKKLVVQAAGNSSSDGIGLWVDTGAGIYPRGEIVSNNWDGELNLYNSANVKTVRLFANTGNSYINAGNVGIGTTSPSQKLEVSGNILATGGEIKLNQGYSFQFGPAGYYIQAPSATRLGVFTGATERLSIDNTGNVGIGTTAPGAKLMVANAAGSANEDLLSIFNTRVNSGDSSGIAFWNGIPGTPYYNTGRISTITENSTGQASLVLSSAGNYGILKEGIRILSNGNVGIGTTNPSANLVVNATAATSYLKVTNSTVGILGTDGLDLAMDTSGNAYFNNRESGLNYFNSGSGYNFQVGSVDKVKIDSNGNVGIGTTNPTYKLDVNGTANIGSTLTLTTAPTTSAGGYDIMTRNTSTGVIEKVLSSTFLTSSSGVSSISGTANQISASSSTGAVTLSIPSDFRAPGTLNAVTSIATGAGAGTVRIDASGNLTNIGTISSGLINSQTISSSANFTGSVNVSTGLTVDTNLIVGDATNNRVYIGAASEGTSSSKLYVTGTTAANGPSSAIAGILGGYTFNPTAGGTQVGDRYVVTNSPTTNANTAVAQLVRVVDNTSLSNTVRGLDITANGGSNTAGTNTGLRASGATFGVQGVISGLGGGVSVPAALYGESTGTTQGDILRLYSTSVTSATSYANFFHSTSTFTGTGLLMKFATGSGSFTGNFIDLQKNNVSLFKVTNAGITSLGLSGTASTTAVCSSLANGTAPTAGTAYELRDCSGAPAADYAEMYPVTSGLEYGDIVATGTEKITTYDIGTDGNIDWNKVKGNVTKLVKSTDGYQQNVVGIVSNNKNDFSSTGYNIKDTDNPMPVALNGRVPVKISQTSSPIKAGDYLTTSQIDPGMATRALRSGFVIGKALEDWTPSSGQNMVMVFVEQGYYESESAHQFAGESTFNGLTFFNANVDFAKSVKFEDVAEFAVPPLFNSDTAGFAIVKAGANKVDVTFDNAYIATPIVNTTVSFEKVKNADGTTAVFDAKTFFDNDIKSVVADKDEKGFTIVLNKVAPQDVRFSWVALAVKNPKIFESVITGLVIDPTSTPTNLVQQTNTSPVGSVPSSSQTTATTINTSSTDSVSPATSPTTQTASAGGSGSGILDTIINSLTGGTSIGTTISTSSSDSVSPAASPTTTTTSQSSATTTPEVDTTTPT